MQQMVLHRADAITSGDGRRMPLGARVMARDCWCLTIVAVNTAPRLRDASASGTRTAFAGGTSRNRHDVAVAVNGAAVSERGLLSPYSGVVVDALEDIKQRSRFRLGGAGSDAAGASRSRFTFDPAAAPARRVRLVELRRHPPQVQAAPGRQQERGDLSKRPAHPSLGGSAFGPRKDASKAVRKHKQPGTMQVWIFVDQRQSTDTRSDF